jgi:nucleotide-binding universal stress UspA family protein
MSPDILDRVLLPIASEDDATTTCRSALPRIAESDGSVIAVHVVEKGGGAPDPTSPTQQEERSEEIFALVAEECEAAGVPLETEVLYGTDVAETVFEAAREEDASAIGFIPRESNRLVDLLAGSPANSIIQETDRPVVIFPSE